MISPVDTAKWTCNKPDLTSPVVMGILNVTPDSFFDGGRYHLPDQAVARAEKMVNEGAAILDVGALSTRPFSETIDEHEEWSRLEKILPLLRKNFPEIIISVDTFRSKVAEKAVEAGADIINDISGGQFDEDMFPLVARLNIPYIMMHIQGTPQTMQQNPQYDDVVAEVDGFLAGQINRLSALGVTENIILDPGFGFGKRVEHNFALLHGIKKIKSHGFPVLAGLSRKSMVNRVLGIKPADALNGTTALNMLALTNGADILRVHDVKEAVEVIKLFQAYRTNF